MRLIQRYTCKNGSSHEDYTINRYLHISYAGHKQYYSIWMFTRKYWFLQRKTKLLIVSNNNKITYHAGQYGKMNFHDLHVINDVNFVKFPLTYHIGLLKVHIQRVYKAHIIKTVYNFSVE